LEVLKNIDKELLLFINSHHSPLFDQAMVKVSERFFWVPLYLCLIIFIFWKQKKEGLYTLLFVGLLIVATDQIASSFFKPLVGRLRPCHDPLLHETIRIVKSCGGQYGFVSSHAANTFGAAIFLILLFGKKYKWMYVLLCWAILVSYSRIYLGVHYPGDILGGFLVGTVSAFLFFNLMQKYLKSKQLRKSDKEN